jgi:hypothetical protein
MSSGYYKRGQRRADADGNDPRAFAICDRCATLYNLKDLSWQIQWDATQRYNTRFLVCKSCYDTPQDQLRTVIPPADPVAIKDARPEFFEQAEVDFWTVEGGDHVLMENSDNLIVTDQASENFPD